MKKSLVTSRIQMDSYPFLVLLYMVSMGSDIVEVLQTKRRVTVAAQVLLLCQVLFYEMDSKVIHL